MWLVLQNSTVPTQHNNRYRLVALRGWPLGIFRIRRHMEFWKQILECGYTFKIAWVVRLYSLRTLRTLTKLLYVPCYTLKGNNLFLVSNNFITKTNKNKRKHPLILSLVEIVFSFVFEYGQAW